jgi:hypothetical protein
MRISLGELEQRVNEGRDDRTLGKHDQDAQHRHDEQNRDKPVFLAYPDEAPEFSDESNQRL